MATNVQEIEKLIDGCLQNDRRAQCRLYEIFAPAMLGVCCRYASSKEEAEDIMIEGFTSVFTSLSTFRRESSLQSWIRSIMVKTAINTFRAHKKFLLHEEMDEAGAFAAGSNMGGDILTKLEARQILALIQEMQEDWRVIFNLRVVEEYSFKEIAEELGRNENTIRVYFQRARAWLLERIQDK